MNLLFPLGLGALAAWLVPLIVHLARRTEQQPTDFAALRWLRPRPRPRHRPRFDERLLLAVRLLLIAAVALVLAQPLLREATAARAVVAVLPGATVPPASEARRIWLAPGFPSVDTVPAPRPAAVSVASLIRQLDADLPSGTTVTIVVPHIVDGADAERPRVSRPVVWRVAGAGQAPPRSVPVALPALRYDPAMAGSRYIAAAVRALGSGDVAPVSAGVPRRSARASIWLAAGALPAAVSERVAAGDTVLVARDTVLPAAMTVPQWRDATGRTLVEAQALGRGRLLRFVRPLDPVSMPELLDPDFPRRLAALFVTDPVRADRVLASAYGPQAGAAAPSPPSRPLWPWCAVVVAVVFAIERGLATRARRAPAP